MKRKGEMMREGDYISFQKASAMLTKRLAATREEVALWAWFGKRLGGFDAFVAPTPSRCCKSDGCDDYSSPRCDGFSPPLQYSYPPDQLCDDDKPWTWLVDAYFLGSDIESFDPAQVGRFISWGDLLTRWQAYGLEENDTLIKVRGRIHDDELTDFAPLFGGTEIGGLTGAPKAWAMFPLADVERIEAREFPPASTAGDSPTVSGAGTVPVETKRAEIITTHRLKSRSNPLNAVIESAAGTALAPNDNQSVWAELVKLAESKDRPAPLVGYSSDGIQYRGKQYEETGELDTFTAKNLRDRMARAKAR